jgi:hypothetical protein
MILDEFNLNNGYDPHFLDLKGSHGNYAPAKGSAQENYDYLTKENNTPLSRGLVLTKGRASTGLTEEDKRIKRA